MSKFSNTKKVILTGVAILTLGVAGAGYYWSAHAEDDAPPQQQQQQAMPVKVDIIKSEQTQIWKDFSARIEAVDYAEIRPQVTGNITEIKFEDGQNVEKGDILFIIDPRRYQAAVDQSAAEVAVAKNRASLAQKEYDRAKGLIKTDAISKRIYDERAEGARTAWAQVKSAEAALKRAEVDLDFAHVKAPISGRLSRAEITEGNLVEAGLNAPVLTSIVSDNGVYADFEVDEQTYLNFIRNNARNLQTENTIPVELKLNSDDKIYKGFIQSFDNRLDVSSGTIRARAFFENKDSALLPGMFANIRMGTPNKEALITVNEDAIGTDQDRKFVYVVDDQNMVQYRAVKIGDNIGGKRIIQSGLSQGDKVITEGIMHVRPGMPVSPQTNNDMPAAPEVAQAQ